ncbi:hypothetical protein ACHAXT_007545 [Thalassiosira profunda]
MSTISGLAASIRAATDSETFDLAGHDAANIQNTIADAFSQPFPLEQMIRITFVTGAGKLARQKYDAKCGQTVTASLRELDYVEDRGASCVNECAGCFKTQHDTGKNLFTVVVFPRLAEKEEGAIGLPAHTVLVASDETFAKMAPAMCPSWSEKRNCSDLLRAAMETVQQMDAKLMTGTPLTDDENEFYDGVGGATSISNKGECLKKLMHEQVEEGKLLEQVGERIDGLNADIDEAMQRSQEKRAAKLSAQKEKAEARRKMLKGHTAKPPPILKHEAKIAQLTKQLKPLLKLEQNAKGRLLTMKETKELAAKDELLEEIGDLEDASCGWFEDEESFQARLEASRKKQTAATSSAKSSSGKGKKPGTGSRSMKSGNTTWLTPGGLASKQAALGKKAAAKKSQPRSNGGGAFAAMMMDSDSDSD